MVPELAKAHESWLEGELAKDATHKVVFQHIPWFVKEPDEEKIYFNVEPGTELLIVATSHTLSMVYKGHAREDKILELAHLGCPIVCMFICES